MYRIANTPKMNTMTMKMPVLLRSLKLIQVCVSLDVQRKQFTGERFEGLVSKEAMLLLEALTVFYSRVGQKTAITNYRATVRHIERVG